VENILRSVNIALVNELAMLCDRMNIDVWEVVEAAATKPYGFMSFKPGPRDGRPLPSRRSLLPGLAGTRVRHADQFIELAGEVNQAMPYFCADNSAGAGDRGTESRAVVGRTRPVRYRHLKPS